MNNTLKTIVLLGTLSGFLLVIGNLIGGQQGLTTALFMAFAMNGISYFFSDKIALSMSGAQPMDRKDAPELFKTTEQLVHKMGIPMPKMYRIPNNQANAFATGRNPQHASVAVTDGLIHSLSHKEVEAVIAHELAHIKNRDILIASIAAVIASAIGYVAQFGLYFGGGNRDEEQSPLSSVFGLLVLILAPLGGSLIQLAISRSREFEADATAAHYMGTGEPLANALISIHQSAHVHPMNVNPAYSSMYIGNPMGGFGGIFMNLFSTHPPVEERIARLRKIH